MVRLQKFLSNAGVSSRRKCEAIIESGQVKVNNRVIKVPWFQVDPERDVVFVRKTRIKLPGKAYLILNKPAGCVTTRSDPEGRKTIMDYIREVKIPVFPVGRLDYDSAGLIFLTNDGELAHRLMHPSFKVPKTYIVKLNGSLDKKRIKYIEKGMMLDDVRTQPAKIKIINEKFNIYQIIVFEGRKHLVKNLFMKVGLRIQKLTRTEFGPLLLGDLKKGRFRYLKNNEVLKLKRMVGL